MKGKRLKKRRNVSPYLFILPFFLIYGIFNLFPAIFSFFISFTKWDGVNAMQFVGIENYIRLFTGDPLFWKSLYNTILMMLMGMPLQIITGLLLAVLLKEIGNKARNVFQVVNFLPYLTIPVAIGLLFQILFDWQYGTVNLALQSASLIDLPINWLGSVAGARFVVVLLAYWKYFGYMMVIFLAGLSTIPEDIYEAARIDGAKWKDQFFRITLPMLKPIISFVLITSIMGSLQFFDEPKLLFSGLSSQPLGGPDRSVLTVVMHFYDTAFERFNYGYGSAIAYGLFVIIFILTVVSMKVLARGEKNEK